MIDDAPQACRGVNWPVVIALTSLIWLAIGWVAREAWLWFLG